MDETANAVRPPRGSPLGFESWARDIASAIACSLNPPPFPDDALPRGADRTVLMIPGFLAGDWTMTRLRQFLESLDYRVEPSGVDFNLGPTSRLMTQLGARLLALSAERGKLALIGQSLGGVLARSLARRHPEAVCHVVTLCTPIRFPITTPLEPFARLLSPLHDPDWLAERDAIAAPLPIPVTAIYSQTDGIVDWRQCVQDAAPGQENLRIDGAHSAMGSNPQAQRAIAQVLGRCAREGAAVTAKCGS
jgi:pimeloyl-ACP methyl ester carboxylesterase